jgi:hypothetical protein
MEKQYYFLEEGLQKGLRLTDEDMLLIAYALQSYKDVPWEPDEDWDIEDEEMRWWQIDKASALARKLMTTFKDIPEEELKQNGWQ